MKNFVVAIDGPAGSGKSSISEIVSEKLGFCHIDTGAMFRAITLYALDLGIDLNDESKYDFLNAINVLYRDQKTYLNGKDVSKEIRSEDVTNNVSTTAKLKCVRDKVIEFERESAKEGLILMDGRDIGTVVLPNADLKIFLTASAEERAKRRCKENELVGIESNYNVILEEIKARDFKDSTRKIAPLKQATDAILIDTTKMSIEEVVENIIKLINNKRFEKMEEKSFAELLEEYENNNNSNVKRGDKVKGTVVSMPDDKTVMLDIQCATEGTLHLDHYTKDSSIQSFKDAGIKIGDEIECEVSKVVKEVNSDHPQILLSRLNEVKNELFAEVVSAKESNTKLQAKVVKDVNKGYILSYKGVELFLPSSQAPKNLEKNATIEVLVIEIDEDRKKAVVSSKAIEHQNYVESREKEYDAVNVGDVLEGTITKVENYAAFVKFDNLTGIIKARDVAHEYVDITTVLKAGDKVKVKVLTKANGKITLSRKELIKSAFEEYKESHNVGDKVSGKVVNKMPYGLLLELAPNLKGLLHNSEYSWNPNDRFDASVVIGDMVEVAITKFEDEKERISLSRKALIDNPWDRVDAKIGDETEVTVTEANEKGLKVTAFGVDGFIPAFEAVERGKNPKDYFAKDDKAEALVIDIDKKQWKLKLSIRKLQDAKERANFEKYLKKEEAKTTIGDLVSDELKK